MNDVLEYTTFGPEVVAFTTKRTLGRDRSRLCQMLCIDDAHLIMPHQTHGVEIIRVDDKFLSRSETERKQLLEGIDAVVTSDNGICIGISTADCIPLLLHDGRRNVIAAVHAGWKGTVHRIVQNTTAFMAAEYG